MAEEEFEPESPIQVQSLVLAERLSRLFDVNGDAIIDSVHREVDGGPQYPGGNVSVRLVPVHTFILQNFSKDTTLANGVSVPSFASHWGVVAGEPGFQTLYHLVLSNDQALLRKNPDTIRGHRRAIEFNCVLWPPKGREQIGSNLRMTKVGVTSYSHQDMLIIGTISTSK
jgi:hypothetical protein